MFHGSLFYVLDLLSVFSICRYGCGFWYSLISQYLLALVPGRPWNLTARIYSTTSPLISYVTFVNFTGLASVSSTSKWQYWYRKAAKLSTVKCLPWAKHSVQNLAQEHINNDYFRRQTHPKVNQKKKKKNIQIKFLICDVFILSCYCLIALVFI